MTRGTDPAGKALGEHSSAGLDAAPCAALALPGTRLEVAEAVSCWEGTFLTPPGRSSVRKSHFHQPSFKKSTLGLTKSTTTLERTRRSGGLILTRPSSAGSHQPAQSHALDKILLPLHKAASVTQRAPGHPGSWVGATGTGKCSLCPLASPHSLPGYSEMQSFAPTPCTS